MIKLFVILSFIIFFFETDFANAKYNNKRWGKGRGRISYYRKAHKEYRFGGNEKFNFSNVTEVPVTVPVPGTSSGDDLPYCGNSDNQKANCKFDENKNKIE